MQHDIPLKRVYLHYTGKYGSFNPLFWLEHAQKTLFLFRICVVIPILISLTSAIFKFPVVQPGNFTDSLNILRFNFLIPLLVIGFALSFLPRFRKIMLQTQVAVGVVTGAYIIMADLVLHVQFTSLYFSMLLLSIIGFTCLMKLRFIGTLVYAGLLLILFTAGMTILGKAIPTPTLLMHYCLLFLSLLFALFLSFQQESKARHLFILNHLLDNEQQKSKFAQIELERMTMRHTSDMIATNQQLYSRYSELLHSERQLQEAISHDTLTLLPHRFLFMDRLEHATDISKLNQTILTVMIINLDHFRAVNDAYGVDFGDKVLQEIARRLKTGIHEGNTITRLGGDEFGILLEDMRNESDAIFAAEKILTLIKQAIRIEKQTLYITACIGLAIYPFDGEDHETLFKNAMIALEKAKSLQINNLQRYRISMDNHAYERMTLGNQLRSALDHGEYVLEYQPQYHALSRRIIGVEALIRWVHPKLGLIPPAHFIPLAEEIGIISSIGEWVIRTACQQMKIWDRAGCLPVPVSVNVSGVQLKQKDFVEQVKTILRETEIDPARLELELTENIVFQNIENNFALLRKFQELGVKLAIDDFGAGYSTLSHLARLPIHTLKIDQLFAVNIMKNPQDAAIVSGIIAIADKLNLNLIAEGIETEDQLNFYIQQGCYNIQGWYFSASLPPEQISLLLKTIAVEPEPENTQAPEAAAV
jgi:diguanylate cyclase (GGDEF)-like protein